MSPSEGSPKSMNRPFVTIAIPTYDRAELLRGCVQSVLAQTYENIEIVVSDNASPDNTPDVLREFDDKRLRVIRQERNIGLLPNWNACLAAAKGEYIVVLSDDDRIDPWMVERCVRLVIDRPDLPIVVALSDFHMEATGHTRPAILSQSFATGIYPGPDILLEYLKGNINVLASCSMLMQTAATRAQGGFPLDFSHTADIAAWARLLFMGDVGFVNEACATCYSHGQSETSRLGTEQLLSDGWKVSGLISHLANLHERDVHKRHVIHAQAQRCFAGRGFTILSEYRRNGANLQKVVNFAWRFRHDLSKVDTAVILRFVAIMLCPRPIADRLRRIIQT